MGYCATIARYVAEWGIAHMSSTRGEGITPFWENAEPMIKHRAIWGIAATGDSVALWRDVGPLRV